MSKPPSDIIAWIAIQVEGNTYLNSEHIVRYITQRQFSIEEIETILLQGKLLETHSHPLRQDAWLILGYVNERPIHIMCAKDLDGNLIVLYAYQPEQPTWKDETTRAKTMGQTRGQAMENKQRKCFFCNSDIEPITVGNFDFRWEGGLYVIKGVPAGLCVQCGEKYISADASRKIVSKIEKEAFAGKDEVLVFEYDG